jgi:hypothetical protein
MAQHFRILTAQKSTVEFLSYFICGSMGEGWVVELKGSAVYKLEALTDNRILKASYVF